MSDQTEVTVEVRWDVPGDSGSSEARWLVSDEPAPHRVMVANVLRSLARDIETGVR